MMAIVAESRMVIQNNIQEHPQMQQYPVFRHEAGSHTGRITLPGPRDMDNPLDAAVASSTDATDVVRRPHRPVSHLVQAPTDERRQFHTPGLVAPTATDARNIKLHDLGFKSLPLSLSVPANSITLSHLYNVETLPPMTARTINITRLDKVRTLPALSGVRELSISSTPLTTIPSDLCVDRLLVDTYHPRLFERRHTLGPRYDIAFQGLMASFRDACFALLDTIPPERLRYTLVEAPSPFDRVTFRNLDAPTWSQSRPSGAPTYSFRELVMPHDWAQQWLERNPARRGAMLASPVPTGVDAERTNDITFEGRANWPDSRTSLPPFPIDPVNSITISHLYRLTTLPAMAARTISVTRLDKVRTLPSMSGVRELRLVSTPIVSIPTTICLDVLHAGDFEGWKPGHTTGYYEFGVVRRVYDIFRTACLSLLDTLPAERLAYTREMRPRVSTTEHPLPDEPVAKIVYLDAPTWSENRPSDAPTYPFREFILPFDWFRPWLHQHPACRPAHPAVDFAGQPAPLMSTEQLRGPLPSAQPTFERAVTVWRQALRGLDFPMADISDWGLNATQTRNFRVFLNRLLETRDYRNVESRPRQIRRVDHMFEILDNRPELRCQFAALATSGTLSCADMATWALNNMDVAVGIEDAKKCC
ncbi:hypothetical protein BDV41DRAFT_39873 [Aspergillus transmontanensis]|uniref:NEL domain-containing protein n=1 Tax=Aspergillus transmontanensis TaxID=1034304 RepID=A0A5N6WC51_9EURO|nr:hypothetical protein BDV41DRAFT_39873 [Aspergillus transmontanensis]